MQAQPNAPPKRNFLELRYFKMRNGHQVERTTTYLQKGWFPAAGRAGIRPVGFFGAVVAPEAPFILSLASYASLGALEAAREKMAADKEFQAASDEFNSMAELSYIRMESSILWTFPSMPAVEIPLDPRGTPAGRAERIFELRTYESPNEKASDRKVKMFGDGEIAIFRKSGMLPVFFAQTIVGSNMPNLTYMLAYDDLAARDRTWRAFSADPDWQKLRSTPGLSDAEIVNNISNAILRPLPFSPIR
jgi:hypothetical protein